MSETAKNQYSFAHHTPPLWRRSPRTSHARLRAHCLLATPLRKRVSHTTHGSAAPAARRGVSAPAALAAAAAAPAERQATLADLPGRKRRGQQSAGGSRTIQAQRVGCSPLRVPRPADSVPPRNAQARAAVAVAGSAQEPARRTSRASACWKPAVQPCPGRSMDRKAKAHRWRRGPVPRLPSVWRVVLSKGRRRRCERCVRGCRRR